MVSGLQFFNGPKRKGELMGFSEEERSCVKENEQCTLQDLFFTAKSLFI